MTNIKETTEIPLSSIVVGEGQVRIRRVDEELDDLVESIRLHGLLEPIVVCPYQGQTSKFEVLMGQRRILAHQRLGRETILAVIIDEPVDEETAKALSLSENLIRRDLDSRDVIDACTALYKKYGSARSVAEETGIPYAQVLKHLKYDRLNPSLRRMVDTGDVTLDIALKAQDAVSNRHGDLDDAAEAVDLAEALSTMTGAERKQILQAKRHDPGIPVKTLLKEFWTANQKNRQIIVTLPAQVHENLQAHARTLGVTQDEAAARLIAENLDKIS
jgi:ParB family chromosome partitioning protein